MCQNRCLSLSPVFQDMQMSLSHTKCGYWVSYQLWVTAPGVGIMVRLCLPVSFFCPMWNRSASFYVFFPPPKEHCFIYSCEFGMFLGGQHPVASPPATRTCLYFYAYFNAEFSMCVFIWFFYVLNSTLHKGIRCCVKNN